MPYEIATFQLPSGTRCVRVELSGTLGKADAAALVEQLGPGGALHRLPILARTQQMDSIEPEARTFFAAQREITAQFGWSGVVVTNPVLRVTINFITRLNKGSKLRVFRTEPEAIRWLEERSREDAAKTATPG